MLGQRKLHLCLANDRFLAAESVFLKQDFSKIRFSLETKNPEKHTAELHLMGLPPGKYSIADEKGPIAAIDVLDGQECDIDLTMDANAKSKNFTIAKQTQQ
jgi:hypothetical protein